ncbi:hypothetical protein B0H14DRAFT_3494017 [Mycena olivaceomarginata]|nr:hypothetical protein B0H14DRAFT_3494017 [Mycena olivaceomarginata]
MRDPPTRDIKLFTQRPVQPNHTRLGLINWPSLIIDHPEHYTLDEQRARHRLIQQQHDDLERAAGSLQRVVAQIAIHLDIVDWGKWQAVHEPEAEAKAAIDQHKRDCQEALLRAEWEDKQQRQRLLLLPQRTHGLLRLVNRRGYREPCDVPLDEDDLYLDDARPPFITFLPPLHFICNICHNIKSHPQLLCLHPRVSGDQLGMPGLHRAHSAQPTPHVEEEAKIAANFPDWDPSRVEYRWDGLVFPTTQLP